MTTTLTKIWCLNETRRRRACPLPASIRPSRKKRPAVVVQSNSYATLVSPLIVAEVTSNLTMANDPACLFIESNTPDGRATGVVRNCVISCLVLVTVYSDTIVQTLGTLSSAMLIKLDASLKAAMALP